MRIGVRGCLAALGILPFFACAAEESVEQTARAESAVVYGADERTDPFAVSDDVTRDLAERSTAVLVSKYQIDPQVPEWTVNPDDVRFTDEGTLGAEYQLCSDERFFNDATAEMCSAVLIDDDLVLTAGHCLRRPIRWANSFWCEFQRYVFNYRNTAPSTKNAVNLADDVFACKEVVVEVYGGEGPDGEGEDYAIVRLDRPATPRFAPAPVKKSPSFQFDAGEPITLIGSPSGMPTKVAPGTIIAPTPGTSTAVFDMNVEAMRRSSGSAVYDSTDHLLGGILTLGPGNDYVEDTASGCYRNRVCSEQGCTDTDYPFLRGVYVAHALQAMCELDPTNSYKLCGAYLQPGDVNGDRAVTSADATMTAEYASGLNPAGFFSGAADVKADGTINIVDAMVIQQYVNGQIPALPIP